MIYSKITLSIICLLSMTFCSVHTGRINLQKTTQLQRPMMAQDGAISGAYGVAVIIRQQICRNIPYLKGWYIVYQWKQLEPEKDKFDWDYFDNQMKFAASHNLSIGFMVWVGPHSPEWLLQ